MEKNENNSHVKCVQFGTISESMRYNGSAVLGNLLLVLHMIQNTWPQINTIHFQSDGSTMQYRNKTNLFLLAYFADKLGLEVTWNFSKAGQNSADSVGREAIDERVVQGLKAITNTMKLKHAVWSSKSPNQLRLRLLSGFCL
ncbi:hypothetical protein JTE90_029199 [Oedothorax gibbosus]|uniref:Calponin-homology (CH) domain-containing protein n=1 Tax=Oedothorax gibbosus TaxID=931172 RepID=A0AAV6TQU4_9ARAC|nr:hypothetical protein JTE90_029199 [Oedothorax gibbosus]